MSKTTMNVILLNVILSTITMLVVVQSISSNDIFDSEFGAPTISEAEKANRGKKCFVEIPVPDNNDNVVYITEQDLQKEGEMCYVKNDLLASGRYEKNLCPCDDGLKCIKLDIDKDTEPDGICVSSHNILFFDSNSLPTVTMSTDTTLTTDISTPATELSTDLPSVTVTAPINVDLSTVPGLPDATTVLSNDSNLLPSVNKETSDTLQLNNREMKPNKAMLCFDSQKPTELPNLNEDEIIDQFEEDQMDELIKYALKIMSEDTSDYKCDANALEKWMQLM